MNENQKQTLFRQLIVLVTQLLKYLFKKWKLFCLLSVLVLFTSCFSILKADKLTYAGSLGKKVDAVIVDSVFNTRVNSSHVGN